ncbi:MAG: hypothetical protein UX91_C0010G0016 [Candidatus Amesbacteria bacterium GW2011_GWB1_47_19]|nr:MAG: hypothetical protein UW51_C0010G0017 [Candidatus Amesbacteria bacterium GW2011_GWA1_44_24]KKU30878.1 MAG: hypothetical protein UX46_C0010G0016 [Candidatus Amesbacteria bacterium GW2011_GWC1_46_24]KKU66567.1 MAG: hypothetical protein UX91_C0010G0016 [Candidatus Amesbacteria bacterium GW2011_GWB1_47_19]OGD05867.1 MAG: hypothetical protein A2379_02040 [Candidatus Amesbacteria bacterium RIFOXYB1_FULL_47_13]HBC73070.1 hypothetical protein [Candidatus Amesbacteria bacterium]
MDVIKELFNKPEGSENQIKAALIARDVVILGEVIITIATSLAIGFLNPKLSPIIAELYVAQLAAAGLFTFGYLGRRLDKLQA